MIFEEWYRAVTKKNQSVADPVIKAIAFVAYEAGRRSILIEQQKAKRDDIDLLKETYDSNNG